MTSLMLAAMVLTQAPPPPVANARVEVRQTLGALAPVFDRLVAGTVAPAWVGYTVPMSAGGRVICDWEARAGASSGPVKLEGPERLHVLARVEQRRVHRVRIFSEGCALDGGGLPLTWLTDVRPADSVAMLRRLVGGSEPSRQVADGALAALAHHAEPTAVDALLAAAREAPVSHVRGQALFWLAQRAGDRAIPAIDRALATDPDTAVKTRAVFALAQLPAGEGVPRLIEVARQHSNPAVRRRAMFWLGQSRDPRALAFFEQILRP